MPSSKSKRPALQGTWIRDNETDGEARYRVRVFGRDARTFDVRISLEAKYQAKPSPEEKRRMVQIQSSRRVGSIDENSR